NGKVICWLGVMIDVTDRKRAEECLRETEERLRTVFETANDVIFIVDLNGNFLSINPAAAKTLGYSVEEALSMNMAQLMPEDQLQIVYRNLKAKLSGDVSTTKYEIVCNARDGRKVTLEISSGVSLHGGKPIGVQGIARDITDRKRAEESLRSTVSLLT